MNKALSFIVVITLTGGFLYPNEPGIIEAFKRQLGYDSDVHMLKDDGVVFGIPDPTICPIFTKEWTLMDDSITVSQSGSEVDKHFKFKGPNGSVFMDFAYSPNSMTISEDRLFDYVISTSKRPIPGKRGPTDIGEFSIIINGDEYSELRFIKRNIFVCVSQEKAVVDLIEVSRWIQSQLQIRPLSEIQNKLPRPAHESIGRQNVRAGQALLTSKAQPLQCKVGEPIEINVEVSGEMSQFIIQEDFDNQRFRSTMINNVLSIIPIKPGRGSFRYVVIDKKTLLFSTYEVPVDVQP